MRQALVNTKSLLVKWIVTCACLVFLLSNLIFQGSAATSEGQLTSQREIVSSTKQQIKPKDKIVAKIANQQAILPPFKSEQDIEVEKTKAARAKLAISNSGGNTYYRGYCTWYAKNKRPDLPNSFGNANTWFARASANGYSTGSKPKPGAIGQKGNHVVYVEKINHGGTVTISEMNYRGFGVVSARTVPATTFRYIY